MHEQLPAHLHALPPPFHLIIELSHFSFPLLLLLRLLLLCGQVLAATPLVPVAVLMLVSVALMPPILAMLPVPVAIPVSVPVVIPLVPGAAMPAALLC